MGRTLKYLNKRDYPIIFKAIGALLDGGGMLNRTGQIRNNDRVSTILRKDKEVGYWLHIDKHLASEEITSHVSTIVNSKRRDADAKQRSVDSIRASQEEYQGLLDGLNELKGLGASKFDLLEYIIKWQEQREA